MSTIRPDTYEAIVEAAFLVFEEYPGASLQDVAERAGVGRATLHRHFPGRSQLMRALAMRAMQELDAAVEEITGDAKTYEEGLRLSLHATVPLATRQWFLAHELFEDDDEITAAYRQNRTELRDAVEAAKQEGAFDKAVPTSWIVEAYENLTYAAWSQVRSGELTSKQAAELAWQTLSRGLKGANE